MKIVGQAVIMVALVAGACLTFDVVNSRAIHSVCGRVASDTGQLVDCDVYYITAGQHLTADDAVEAGVNLDAAEGAASVDLRTTVIFGGATAALYAAVVGAEVLCRRSQK